MADIAVRKDAPTRENAPQRTLSDLLRWSPFRDTSPIFRWDPFQEMAPLMADTPTVFNPAFEVKETKDAYLFKADLPGMKESDVEVTLTGNRLTVSGNRNEEKEESNETYYSCERKYGSFSRSYTLPEGADTDHIHADLKAGVLTVAVPKKPEVQPKKIAVKSAGTKV